MINSKKQLFVEGGLHGIEDGVMSLKNKVWISLLRKKKINKNSLKLSD